MLECTKHTDCPNGGQNYECVSNVCSCVTGFILDGDACVGMFSNYYFHTFSMNKTIMKQICKFL